VGGIKTTLPFFREIVRDDEFIAARLDTGFISRFNERRVRERGHAGGTEAASLQQDIAVIAAALTYAQAQRLPSPNHQQSQSNWKMAGRQAALANSVIKSAK
jgi:acetyl/propionyl-CoA carboxylase alpha subunit